MGSKLLLLLSGLVLLCHVKTTASLDLLSDILSQVAENNKAIQKHVNAQVARAKQRVEEAMKRTRHEGKEFDGGSSSSHVVQSGHDENGKPYYIEREESVIGDTLYRTERVYNRKTKKIEERHYTLDLSDPEAKPVRTNRGTL